MKNFYDLGEFNPEVGSVLFNQWSWTDIDILDERTPPWTVTLISEMRLRAELILPMAKWRSASVRGPKYQVSQRIGQWHQDGQNRENLWCCVWTNMHTTEFRKKDYHRITGLPEGHLLLWENNRYFHRTPQYAYGDLRWFARVIYYGDSGVSP